MKMTRNTKLSPRAFEELSAYIDGQLKPQEALAFEKKLSRSSKLQKAHREVLAMRKATRALPKRKAPRNFILTRAEAAEARRGRNLSRVFGLAFSLCAVFLVVLFGYDGLAKGLFAMKAAAPEMAMPEEMPQAYALRSAPDLAAELPVEMLDESVEEPVEEQATEEAVLLTWGAPSAMTAEGSGAMDSQDLPVPMQSPYQSDSALASKPTQVLTTEMDFIKIHLNPVTGAVTICDPVYGCGYGGSIQTQSGTHLEAKNEIYVDPALIYFDQRTGMLKLCPELGACPTGDENLIAVKAVEPGETMEDYGSAFPLIFGMDHENEGEVISSSPQWDDSALEGGDVLVEEVYEEAPVGPYDDDSDHQAYLKDQFILWLKIGLAGLAIVFGIIWLIIRRR